MMPVRSCAEWSCVAALIVVATACGSSNPPSQKADPTVLVAGTFAPSGTGTVSEGTTVGGVAGVSGIQPVAGSAGIATITGVAGSAAVGGGGGADGMARATAGGAGGSVGSKNNCGARSGMRGKTSRSIMVSGSKRTFIAYLPQMANATQPLPFVYVFHGATQTGQQLYDMTEYAKLADSEGIAVVFPDGQGVSSLSSTGSLTPWSVTDGPPVCGAGTLVSNLNAVDFAFVDAIKTDLEQDQCIDDKHIYATGFSMGGYFTHHIACDRMDFRAAAPHSGGTMAALSSCTTGHMPIIIFHGTADPLIAGSCDDPKLSSDPSFPPSATLWAEKNGCKPTYTTIPANGTSGSNGTCYMYDGCPADGQVEMCSFQDMAHCWAGAPVCPGCIGEGPNYASATKLQWEFFKKYAW